MPAPSLREFVLVKNTMESDENIAENKEVIDVPTNGEIDQYWTSYDNVEVHRLMIQDEPRTSAYQQAILSNKHLFSGKVVMDVGAGTGILSLFAMKAGARKVYAVEASPMADVLKEIVELNDEKGVISVIHGKAEDVDLPEGEKVDVMISEWMGFYLFHESMLDSVILAREKHLDDDGIMFPSHATVLAAPVQLQQMYREQFDSWRNVYGFDMTPMAQKAVEARLVGGEPEILQLSSDQLLSAPVAVGEWDMRWVDVEEVRVVKDRKFVSITRQGNLHGLAVWFAVKFDPILYEDEMSQEVTPVTLSTGPGDSPTHWKQTVIVLPRAEVEVDQDEVVGWDVVMEQDRDNKRRYNISLALLDPAEDEHPVPCGCQMAKCALYEALLKKEEEDFEEMSLQKSQSDD